MIEPRKILFPERGVTLVELMVVIAIIAIAAAVIVPSIREHLPRYQLRAIARELMVDFKIAKTEAIKRNRNVLLEFTQETAGDPNAGGSYTICVDDNTAANIVGQCTAAEIIKTVAMPRQARLTDAFNNDRAGYNSRGLPWHDPASCTDTGPEKCTVTLQASDGSRTYKATVSLAGGVTLK
jgi:type IV fimbrial biogenesis protein FimT